MLLAPDAGVVAAFLAGSKKREHKIAAGKQA